MEPMITISVEDYNKLVTRSLGNIHGFKVFARKIKNIYLAEKGEEHEPIPEFVPDVAECCDYIIKEIEEKEESIPRLVSKWTKDISSGKSES